MSAGIHPNHHTPAPAILVLTGWAAILVLSGHFKSLYTLVLVPSWILYGMAAASVIVLAPQAARPAASVPDHRIPLGAARYLFSWPVLLLISTLIDSPRESLLGLLIILAGVPFYLHWRKKLPAG